ncbi:class E sortase [Mobiluncus porci]|uniref:class E sortase n=1 Tax=Mobiluncus porci TaxID=2652278 RepID=UPI0030B8A318
MPEPLQPAQFPSRRQRRELAGEGQDGRMMPARQLEPESSSISQQSSAIGQQPSRRVSQPVGKPLMNPTVAQPADKPLRTPAPRPAPQRPTSSQPSVAVSPQPPLPPDSVLKSQNQKRKTKPSILIMSGIGQTMLTLGVVLALFVVWQLYVTTWQVQGATAAAVESFTSSTANDATETTEVQRTDPPPPVTIPAVGQTFATLHVPRWDSMVIPVMQGTTESILNTGYAGHYTDTQGPGELGNFALAAHRRSYGNSFRRVEELVTGDPLVVETSQAWLVYQVTSTEVVLPTQGDVIYPVPHQPKDTVPSERLMTLTTCHPEYGNTERFIVYSKLSYWVPRTQGRPVALQGLEAMNAAGQQAPAESGSPTAPPAQQLTPVPGQPNPGQGNGELAG